MIQSSRFRRNINAEEADFDKNSTEEDTKSICPLCDFSTEDSLDIHTHLQVSHKKSEIAGLVVNREPFQNLR
jgi:hypothetical protein